MTALQDDTPGVARPEISLVIPVYNGSRTIGDVVREIHEGFRGRSLEVVLVNDGSTDGPRLDKRAKPET